MHVTAIWYYNCPIYVLCCISHSIECILQTVNRWNLKPQEELRISRSVCACIEERRENKKKKKEQQKPFWNPEIQEVMED